VVVRAGTTARRGTLLGVSGGEEVSETDAAKVIALPPVLYLGSLLAGIFIHQIWPLPFLSGWMLRVALGLFVVSAAGALVMSALLLFRRIDQDPNPRTPTSRITQGGAYRFTRNPMYVGLSLIQIGIGIALGNAWILILLLPTCAVMHYGVILPEEAYLERKFGDEYLRFKSSVRRWL